MEEWHFTQHRFKRRTVFNILQKKNLESLISWKWKKDIGVGESLHSIYVFFFHFAFEARSYHHRCLKGSCQWSSHYLGVTFRRIVQVCSFCEWLPIFIPGLDSLQSRHERPPGAAGCLAVLEQRFPRVQLALRWHRWAARASPWPWLSCGHSNNQPGLAPLQTAPAGSGVVTGLRPGKVLLPAISISSYYN